MSKETPVILQTGNNPVACVIWLHGLGADGHDFEAIVPELNLPADKPIRFVFPHAPKRAVTINGGMVMRAWFDMFMGERSIEGNADHIRESQTLLTQYIDQQCAEGFDRQQIILAGFSQGGAIVLQAGLRTESSVAGILALSTYLPLHESFEAEKASVTPPVFLASGRHDRVLPFGLAELSRDHMRANGVELEWHDYDMEHAVCMEEIAHIRQWLLQRLEAINV